MALTYAEDVEASEIGINHHYTKAESNNCFIFKFLTTLPPHRVSSKHLPVSQHGLRT